MEQKVDQSPCESMKQPVAAWEKFKASGIGQLCINVAPTVCTFVVILLLAASTKIIGTITVQQNTCMKAQVEAGVPKTNPKEMGCS